MYYTQCETALGNYFLVGNDKGISQLLINNRTKTITVDSTWVRYDSFFQEATKQLREYTDGKRKVFDLLLNLTATPFQQQVWQALQTIPYGQTRSYKQIAEQIGNPDAARAIGMANNRNPIPLIIPCHRVISSDGSLTGYAYGLALKQQLIQLEYEYK
ncbi:MAG: methylated-DNA--[protein]-cysteine S-methyltransferase [Ostreibacterium sp.]